MTDTVRSDDSTSSTTGPPGGSVATRPAGAGTTRGQRWALAAILLLALLVNVWGITTTGWSNSFYAAAVKSMLGDFTNFVFGSFDPAGVTTVDKPPMALWPQVVSAWIFGFHGWSLLLPQVVEACAAVFLLHRTVRRWAGENAALLAALVLAVTPVAVTVNRSNLPDTLLILFGVAAAYAVTRAVDKDASAGSATKWLAQAAFWIGCGFLTKMLAAWMLLPALVLAYLFGRDSTWRRRLTDLAVAAGVLLVSSLWWVVLTSLWPGDKPFIGGSEDGSVWNLVLGYNGLGMLFGQSTGGGTDGGAGGRPGLLRMFNLNNGGQISWLIPLALFALVVVVVAGARRALPAADEPTAGTDRTRRAGWLLWGCWLVVVLLVFSYQEVALPYYTIELAPAIAALTGAGLVVLWRYYQKPDGAGWLLLPAGIALTAVWAWVVISRDTSWQGWLRYAVAVVAAVAVLGLLAARRGSGALRRVAVLAGVVAVVLAPAVWSVTTALTAGKALATGDTFTAGPSQAVSLGAGAPGLPSGQQLMTIMRTGELPSGRRIGSADLSAEQRRMLDYVRRNSGDAEIKLAFEGGSVAASTYIIDSDTTVVGMGGFVGRDPVPMPNQLDQWQRDGRLAFVFSYSDIKMSFGPFGPGGTERTKWVLSHCTAVPASAYGGKTAAPGQGQLKIPNFLGSSADTLYDCTRR
ncbi:ArnT family glycosyltransferase [Amycolatopsis taiwanensis]|uniref:Membrane protein n=1 Tax=Amycolatopsis taiwanensis TaxID=342230 RepID=A0A9W6VE34_9PSEU|nr:glycosyltransferase family 39 protein [Amycolatopsis taiwanensis]GLY68018.1 membrane protein [Amycolatopsis taiwanensis]